MDDRNSPKHQYTKGVQTIRDALIAAMAQKGFPGAYVTERTHAPDARVPDTIFTVMANGQTEEMTFTYEEIKDSAAHGIDSYANLKVLELVSRFS